MLKLASLQAKCKAYPSPQNVEIIGNNYYLNGEYFGQVVTIEQDDKEIKKTIQCTNGTEVTHYFKKPQ